MSLRTAQAELARLLVDGRFREAALRGAEKLPDALRGLDSGRVEAFARQLAAKRTRALQRALPVSISVMGERASEWLRRYQESCPPRVGAPGADAEQFAGFLADLETDGSPDWLRDLARYESARSAVRRAPLPVRRAALSPALLSKRRLVHGPAMRLLDLAWEIPKLLPEVRRGARPEAHPVPVFLLLGRAPERGDVRERPLNRATWELLRRCDGTVTLPDAIETVGREVGVPESERAAFAAECLRALGTLMEAGLLLEEEHCRLQIADWEL